jgi:hypothetical protein
VIRASVLLALALLFAGGCEHRREPLRRAADAGPAVVVVETRPTKVAAPPEPLIDEREPDDDLASAQPLEAGKGIRGTLSAPKTVRGKPVGDVDFYSFIAGGVPALPDGGVGLAFDEARVELGPIPGVDLSLEALDGDGKRLWLASGAGAGQGEVIPNLALEAGHTYYLKVRAVPSKGAAAPAGAAPYSLVMREAPAPPGDEREPNDRAEEATPLPAVGDASGFFGRRRDEDWFSVPLAGGPGAGATLRLELSPTDGVAPQIAVRSGTTLLAQARASRGGELELRNVGLPPGASGVLIQLKAVEGQNTDVRWTLRMSLDPPLDGAEREPNDTAQAANPLPLGSSVSGFLWPGDVDLYRVTGCAAGCFFSATLDGVPHVALKLERLGPGGEIEARADGGGVGKGETLASQPGGEVLLRVKARPRDTAFEAPYKLTVTAQAAPDHPDLGRP